MGKICRPRAQSTVESESESESGKDADSMFGEQWSGGTLS